MHKTLLNALNMAFCHEKSLKNHIEYYIINYIFIEEII